MRPRGLSLLAGPLARHENYRVIPRGYHHMRHVRVDPHKGSVDCWLAANRMNLVGL